MTTDISWAQVATELKYEYFDRAIPHFLQQDPQSAVEKIRDQGLRRFLRVCWDAIEMRAGLTDELEEYPFTVVQGADSHPNGPWMVHFVEPKQPVELFAAVIVPEPNRNRYLTLEFFDKRNRSKGIVCEWADGQHINYGPESGVGIEGFEDYLVSIQAISGDVSSVESDGEDRK